MKGRRTRSQYVILNSVFSFFEQIIKIGLAFIVRTVFIQILGKEILGINGLFTNILNILSISELGVNTAITYSLYMPLAEKDEKKISAYMNIYRKAYHFIGCVIFCSCEIKK